MSKLFVVAVLDKKLEAYGRPVFVPTLGVAIRSFEDECQNPQAGDMSKHPEDFELFQLAVFDDVSGKFENLAQPTALAVGAQRVFPLKEATRV